MACVLAMHGISGYEHVWEYLLKHHADDVERWDELYRFEQESRSLSRNLRALRCLCLIANPNIIPKTAMEAAAQCGGLEPGLDENHPHPYGPNWLEWADPGNDVYARMVNQIIREEREQGSILPAYYQTGYDELVKFNDEQKAECVEAYLGAADAAHQLYGHTAFHGVHKEPWYREYNCLEGGNFIMSDDNASSFTYWMKVYHARKPPMPWPKSFRDARDAQRADFLSRLS